MESAVPNAHESTITHSDAPKALTTCRLTLQTDAVVMKGESEGGCSEGSAFACMHGESIGDLEGRECWTDQRINRKRNWLQREWLQA